MQGDKTTRSLGGQVAVVTGAARGIGLAIARRIADAGADVVVVDIDGSAAERAAVTLPTAGSRGIEADVADPTAVARAFARIADDHGRLDILVNNAGIYPHIPFDDLTFEQWQHVSRVNLDSVYLCSVAALAPMRRQQYGRIVNISSGAWLIGVVTLAPYLAAKAGVVALTRVMSNVAGSDGVTVNAVYPGLIETENTLGQIPHLFDPIVAGQDVPRRGLPTDIAECVAYLVQPEASFLTGQTINVDGGLTYC